MDVVKISKREIKKSILRQTISYGKAIKTKDIKFPPEIFVPLTVSPHLDNILSFDGGLHKATNWMLDGDPGAGKTTLGLDIAANIELNNHNSKSLFISAEMNAIDMKFYVNRYPKFDNISTLYIGGIDEKELIQKLEQELLEGYDVVIIDSFVELCLSIREAGYHQPKNTKDVMTTDKGATSYLLDLMEKHNMGENYEGKYTSFIFIQQVGKGGTFVGSNRIKHMTTGTFHVKFENSTDRTDRYLISDKHRRGEENNKIYFDLSSKGDVNYDVERFERDKNSKKKKQEEKTLKKKETITFNTFITESNSSINEEN